MARPALKLADHTTRRPVERFAFTKAKIEALDPPVKGRRYVYDERQAGLALAITPTGHRSFYFYRWANGKPIKLKLGNFGDITIAQARDRVKELTGDITKGDDPAAKRRRQRDITAKVPTVKAAWEAYRDNHLRPNRSPVTLRNDQYHYRSLGSLRSRRLDTISTEDVRRLHRQRSLTGRTNANRTVQFLCRLYNYAIESLGYTGENPVKLGHSKNRRGKRSGTPSIALNHEQSRQRYVEPAEMPGLINALDAETDPDFADFVRIMLYTAARRSNVQAMAWREVSFRRRVWTISGNAAKAGSDIVVPLSTFALAILKRRWANATEDATFVFPAKRSASGHMQEPKKKWWALRHRAGLGDVSLHDLRRTVASWASNQGTTYPVVKAMLGHSTEHEVTMIYCRTDVETVRAEFQRTTEAMMRQAGRLGGQLATVRLPKS